MTFTDEQIKRQQEKIQVLQYLVDGRTDDWIAANNLLDSAENELRKQTEHLNFMKQNKETN